MTSCPLVAEPLIGGPQIGRCKPVALAQREGPVGECRNRSIGRPIQRPPPLGYRSRIYSCSLPKWRKFHPSSLIQRLDIHLGEVLRG